MKFYTLIFVLMSFILSACSSTNYTCIEKPKLILPDPKPLVLKQVKFEVIKTDKTYIALDTANYENLSYNMLQIQRFINEQNIIINKYKKE